MEQFVFMRNGKGIATVPPTFAGELGEPILAFIIAEMPKPDPL